MAYLFRLIFSLMAALAFGPAFAAECSPEYRAYRSFVDNPSGWATTKTDAANAWCTWAKGAGQLAGWVTCVGEETGYMTNGGVHVDLTFEERPRSSCEEQPKTADEKCADLAALYNSWNWGGGREGVVDSTSLYPLDEPFQVCMSNSELGIGRPGDPPGCMHNFTPTMKGRLEDVGPWRYWGDSWMVGPVQGRACVPGLDGQPGDPPNVPPAEPQGPCKGFEGSVNGVDVCIDPSSGYTEGIDWTQVTDANGNIKEQKTEIKCEGEKCTVTTTIKTPGASGGTTATTTTTRGAYCAKSPESAVCKGADDMTGSTRNQNGRGGPGDPAANGGGSGGGSGGGGGGGSEGNGFCKENPDSPICKNGTFGGSCAANFSCEGDAIQCAIAKEQHLRNCKLFDDESDESRLYGTEKAKDPNRKVTDDLKGNKDIDIAGIVSASDQFLGGGSCPADRSIVFRGQTITIPFYEICPYLIIFGNVLVIIASIFAVRIIFGRV